MSWQGQISTMVRHLINDVDSTNYMYSPKRLETTILVAAQLLTTETSLRQEYTISISDCSLSPDPTDAATKDSDFISLVSLKCACVILGSEVKKEAGNTISIKDGPSAIDLRGVASTIMALYQDLCVKYQKLLLDYSAGNSIAGIAILGPYSPGSNHVSRHYSDNNHRGGFFRH